AYASMGDSQGKLENFSLGQAAAGREETPEELAAEVRTMTPRRIFDAMETVHLDTVYFLRGKEAAE
ncbi:MAG: insulinase family protein, partial [Oscillospiraceae bacterium]|nr:insulinase family protein [Oscillospiraceae bacterium]